MCRLSRICFGNAHGDRTGSRLDEIIRHGGLLTGGHVLFRQGDRFTVLFAVKTGYFKTSTIAPDGSEQVLAFHLPGDILGLDAIHDNNHRTTATALSSASVCAIPYMTLAELASADPSLQQRMFGLLSREIGAYMGRVGDATADARLAGFLLEMSVRFKQLGCSADRITLVMPRRDIGNYLRLATETVSRVLTRFQQDGLIAVSRRDIDLLDKERLRSIAEL